MEANDNNGSDGQLDVLKRRQRQQVLEARGQLKRDVLRLLEKQRQRQEMLPSKAAIFQKKDTAANGGETPRGGTVDAHRIQDALIVYIVITDCMRDKGRGMTAIRDREPLFWRREYAKAKTKLAAVCTTGAAVLAKLETGMPQDERDGYGEGHYGDIRFDLELAAKILRANPNWRVESAEEEEDRVVLLLKGFLARIRYLQTFAKCIDMAGVAFA